MLARDWSETVLEEVGSCGIKDGVALVTSTAGPRPGGNSVVACVDVKGTGHLIDLRTKECVGAPFATDKAGAVKDKGGAAIEPTADVGGPVSMSMIGGGDLFARAAAAHGRPAPTGHKLTKRAAIADKASNRVHVYAREGESWMFEKAIEGVEGPEGLCWSGHPSELFVAEAAADRISVFAMPSNGERNVDAPKRLLQLPGALPTERRYHIDAEGEVGDEIIDRRRLASPSDVGVCPRFDNARATGGPLADFLFDAPPWWLGEVTQSAAAEALEGIAVGGWAVRTDTQCRGDFMVCYVDHEAWRNATVYEHLFRAEDSRNYWHGPFSSKICADVAAEYHVEQQSLAGKSDAVARTTLRGNKAEDERVTTLRLTDLIRLVCKQHGLKWPPRRFPGGRATRLVAVADTGHDRVALFQYASERFSLFDAGAQWCGQVRGGRLNKPRSVAWSNDGDLVVGDEYEQGGDVPLSEIMDRDEMRARAAKRLPGRITVFAAGKYDVVRSVIILRKPGDLTTLDRLPAWCVTAVMKGASAGAPLVRFWCDGDQGSATLPPRIVCVAGGKGRTAALAVLSPPQPHAAGLLGQLPKTFVLDALSRCGHVDCRAARVACRTISLCVAELRWSWKLFPLVPADRKAAAALFDRWARLPGGPAALAVDARATALEVRYRPECDLLLARMRDDLRASPSPYAIHAKRDAVDAVAAVAKRPVVLSQEDDVWLDFGRGVRSAVANVHGARFWWAHRASLAEDFVALAAHVIDFTELVDERCRADPVRHRARRTVRARALGKDDFLEFWTRLEESRQGLRWWAVARGDAAALLETLGDGAAAGAALLAAPAPDDFRRVEAHLRCFEYHAAQAQASMDRVLQRSLAPTGPGSSGLADALADRTGARAALPALPQAALKGLVLAARDRGLDGGDARNPPAPMSPRALGSQRQLVAFDARADARRVVGSDAATDLLWWARGRPYRRLV
ncbi:hypothetical protein M885DRAFT_586477 [Pelagophyceae sp. CCMP2097]|nr:hypothetical protein M885DRAFT_586477 [Pelagophyceae sp. CCMP2097]